MSFLVIGLGNIGAEYRHTRHNIGFDILDQLAKQQDLSFESERYAFYTSGKIRGKSFHLIKPSTYMNLSGKAVRYWMNKLKIKPENILVVTDDLNLPLGKLRMRAKGSAGGHNGLKNIQELLGSPQYPRLRVGVGDNFSKGHQVSYVLGKWNEHEIADVSLIKDKAEQAIYSFITRGISATMTEFNG